jgi:tetratricopeptide (TPR) repeat protein
MKQDGTDKYSIAWFKLADCIARGEKERAIGVFRLLSHSLDDNALSQQLYGDILLSFNDKVAAQERYLKAAEMYQEDDRLLEAAAVYEHLVALAPDQLLYREKLVELYQGLGIGSKVREYATALLGYLLDKSDWQKAVEIARMYDSAGDCAFTARMHEKLVFALVEIKNVLPDTIMIHVKKVIDAWQMAHDERALKEFMNKLEVCDEALYEHAQKYITD